jgi:hypothetical protein
MNPYEPPPSDACSSDRKFGERVSTIASRLVGFGSLVLVVAIFVSPFVGNVDSWIDFIAPVSFVLGVCTIIFLFALREEAKFNEKYPPIDDKEFIRRCRPGVNPKIALRVRRIVSNSLGIEYERIHPEQSFVKDLNCG